MTGTGHGVTQLLSVGVNSSLYAPLTWCQLSMVRTAQTEIWWHPILHHPQYSSPFCSMCSRVPALSVWHVLLTVVAVNLVGFRPDFHTDLPSAYQKALAVEYQPRKLELLPVSGFIGGEYLPSHDKGHIVPKARLNHDFLTSLAQDIPYSRYHFLHRCHSSRTRQMWYVTTNTSLNPDPGITL